MLPKNLRIPTQNFPTGKPHQVVRGNFVCLHTHLCPQTINTPLFAVPVSKKIFSNAVERNMFRRRVYGFLEESIECFQGGVCYIFFPTKKAQSASRKEILEDIEMLVSKL